MNGGLVRRHAKCTVCRSVAAIEDVTVRLFDADGDRLVDARGRGQMKGAIDYLHGIGIAGTPPNLRRQLETHVRHVSGDLRNPPAVVDPKAIVRVEPDGPTGWVRANEIAVDQSIDALRELAERMPSMSDKDFNTAVRILMGQVVQRGNWAAKGRQMDQVDALIDLASGFDGPDA